MNKQGLVLSTLFLAGVMSTYFWVQQPTVVAPPPAPPPVVEPVAKDGVPTIKLAIMLDTSNSMDGLIDQARNQLWRVVNEFGKARYQGQPARLEVALYEFGNDGLSSQKNYLRRVVPFTTELDKVSEELFALRTNGGEEYAGAVIAAGLSELDWSKRPGDLNLVFVAGNEPFDQGPTDFRSVCGEAMKRGISVNTIFCGSPSDGDATLWAQGASLGDGRFLTLDTNQKVAYIQAPQDAELARLSTRLNQSYIPYGGEGQVAYARQAAQDENAAGASSEVVAYRAAAKSSASYNNASWDLVDAVKDKKVDVGSLSAAELPAPMQKLSASERREYVAGKQKERTELQAEIQKLTAERDAYVAAERAKQGRDQTLDALMISTVQEQATRKGYSFK